MKAKYIGKVQFVAGGDSFTPGESYDVEEELLNTYSKFFEVLETPKGEEAPKPRARPRKPKSDD